MPKSICFYDKSMKILFHSIIFYEIKLAFFFIQYKEVRGRHILYRFLQKMNNWLQ